MNAGVPAELSNDEAVSDMSLLVHGCLARAGSRGRYDAGETS